MTTIVAIASNRPKSRTSRASPRGPEEDGKSRGVCASADQTGLASGTAHFGVSNADEAPSCGRGRPALRVHSRAASR